MLYFNPDLDQFSRRHIGPSKAEIQEELQQIGVNSLAELIDKTIPASIRMNGELEIGDALTEAEYLEHIQALAKKNKCFKSYIGQGYYNTYTPTVIQRNILENPGWYTQYTPYQAEIAQGRLEALLNFQTVVSELTGFEIANASLLDEATAAAEAMSMSYDIHNKKRRKSPANTFLVSAQCFPQTIEVIKTRAEPLGIDIVVEDHAAFNLDDDVFALIVQYPDGAGAVHEFEALTKVAQEKNILVIAATDLLALTLLKSPAEWGADIAVGNSQRFGVPLGYGGPHAGFFATKEDYKRLIPGRIIGLSKDRHGKPAYRMALQTREQHIRREKATSNICTAQALLAVMAGMYAVYHGPEGLKQIASRVHYLACILVNKLSDINIEIQHQHFFDTISVSSTEVEIELLKKISIDHSVNLSYSNGNVGISIDETTTYDDIEALVEIFALAKKKPFERIKWNGKYEELNPCIQSALLRKDEFLQQDVFNRYHSEAKMTRYIKKLENRDLSLTHSIIPLGSCTMKLNATTQLMPVSYPEFNGIHPFVPLDQVEGYRKIFEELESDLCNITGFDACSLQPNSGAQGEYTGLMVIRAYHRSKGEQQRNVVLIPSSAHGTNPASAIMAGMQVVVVKCDEDGNIDLEDLKAKTETHSDVLCALMITYPSTHGVFETAVKEVCATIHQHGGRVYMDGANMNAQVGYTNPKITGADVCHLNLHKTFSIPHGGGGPGMGPICVTAELAPFLPSHTNIIAPNNPHQVSAISAAPWGSPSILLISYAYIKLLGNAGLKDSTAIAILNANYIKSRLEAHYDVLYTGVQGYVAHELILDLRPYRHSLKVEVEDIAKRLMDYGFHAPTVSFPVPGTLMIEPTESESKGELDRFCDAMIAIKQEIEEVASGAAHAKDNVLKNAPHTQEEVSANEWPHDYSREKAAYPLAFVRENKFWASVGRVDNSHGDRNLICTCPAVEEYESISEPSN